MSGETSAIALASKYNEIVAKYNISDSSVVRAWIKKYNANKKLRDYKPQKEVYMAEALRKTTKDERLEIVQYCLDHSKDYKCTAALYDVSYSQVYSWCFLQVIFGKSCRRFLANSASPFWRMLQMTQ